MIYRSEERHEIGAKAIKSRQSKSKTDHDVHFPEMLGEFNEYGDEISSMKNETLLAESMGVPGAASRLPAMGQQSQQNQSFKNDGGYQKVLANGEQNQQNPDFKWDGGNQKGQ